MLNETKFSRGDKLSYVETAIIFAGPVIIRVEVEFHQPGRGETLAQRVHRGHADRGAGGASAGPAERQPAESAEPVTQ